MNANKIDKIIKEFNEYLDTSIYKFKPVQTGTRKTLTGMASYIKSYGEKFIEWTREIETKANEYLKEFGDGNESEAKELRERLENEIKETVGMFKKKYWDS